MAKKIKSITDGVVKFLKKYIIFYGRQSVEKDNSNSIENQFDKCYGSLTEDDKKYEIIKYVDEGKTGTNVEREGFQQMMADVESGKVKKIVVYKLDRISRSIGDFVEIWKKLKKFDVDLVSTQEHFDTKGPYGEMLLKVLVCFAEFEATCIRERVRDIVESRTNMGLFHGGRVPKGFEVVETEICGYKTKKYSPIEEEIKQIKFMYDLYSRGGISLSRVLDAMIEEGYGSIRGSAWSTSKISSTLRNPIYVRADMSIFDYYNNQGIRMVNKDELERFDGIHALYYYGKREENIAEKKIVVAPHEGIVDSHKWLRVQELLDENEQIKNANVGKRSWLSGLVQCGKCGCNMCVTMNQDRRYFNCNSKKNTKNCAGPKGTIYADDLEEYVREAIAVKISSLKFVISGVMSDEVKYEYNKLDIELHKLEQQELNLAESIANDGLTEGVLEAITKKSKMIASQKDDLIKKMTSLTTKMPKYEDLSPLKRKWRDASYSEMQSVARAMISGIIVHPDCSFEIIWKA